MSRKPLDPRIKTLISNSVQSHTRSFFFIVGSQKQQNLQITNLHYLLTLARQEAGRAKTARPDVLWCYKKDLGFTSNRKQREGKRKRDIKRGIREEGELDPFETFVTMTNIRYWRV
jgi:N-acetyltransferase 10